MLLPDSPELMDNSVGDCLSARLLDDMLMGRERLYGSRLNAEVHMTVKLNQNKQSHHSFEYFHIWYLLPELVPPAVDGEVCTEQRQQPTPLRQIHQGKTERNPPGNKHQPHVQTSPSIMMIW